MDIIFLFVTKEYSTLTTIIFKGKVRRGKKYTYFLCHVDLVWTKLNYYLLLLLLIFSLTWAHLEHMCVWVKVKVKYLISPNKQISWIVGVYARFPLGCETKQMSIKPVMMHLSHENLNKSITTWAHASVIKTQILHCTFLFSSFYFLLVQGLAGPRLHFVAAQIF